MTPNDNSRNVPCNMVFLISRELLQPNEVQALGNEYICLFFCFLFAIINVKSLSVVFQIINNRHAKKYPNKYDSTYS